MDTDSLYVAGARVHVKNPKKGPGAPEWITGLVSSKEGAEVTCEITVNSSKLKISAAPSSIPLVESLPPLTTNNIASHYKFPSHPGIIDCITSRYTKNAIYTAAGAALVCVNPFNHKPAAADAAATINDYPFLQKTRTRVSDFTLQSMTAAKRATLEQPPHPYILADDAFNSLLNARSSQTIVCTGIAGAGKSEVGKLALQYLLALKHVDENPEYKHPPRKRLPMGPLGMADNPNLLPPHGDKDAGKGDSVSLARLIAASNNLLECFGSAATTVNSNSSRFGRFIKVFFGGTTDVAGCRIETYFLDKQRVVKQAAGERGFHIFYQCILGASSAMRNEHTLKTLQDYAYLNNVRIPGMNDEIEFTHTLENLKTCNFTPADITHVLNTLAAILELGNVTFGTGDGNASLPPHSKTSVALVETLLSLPPDSLAPTLLQKAIGTTRGKTTTVDAAVDAALLSRDTLAKTLYTKLFDWVVAKCNKTLADATKHMMERARQFAPHVPGAEVSEPLYVGVVDMPGFENAKENGFDQFITNYASEKLQNQCVKSLYESQFTKYTAEGLSTLPFPYATNAAVCDVLDKKPQGILCMLDEACRYPRNTDKTFLQKIAATHMRARANGKQLITKPESNPDEAFVVLNSFGDTTYNVNNFLESNKDRLGAHISEALAASKSTAIASYFKEETTASSTTSTSAPTTVSKRLIDEIGKLTDAISNSNLLLVRCIMPNSTRTPGKVDIQMVQKQILDQDILAAVKMRQDGFTSNNTFLNFYERFIIVIPANADAKLTLVPKPGSDFKQLCKLLLSHLYKLALLNEPMDSSVFFGSSCVFLKHKTIQAFEALRKVKLQDMDRAAVLLQATWRMGSAKLQHLALKKGVCRMQAAWKGIYYRHRFLVEKNSISILQRYALGYVARKKYVSSRQASRAIANFYQKLKGRVRWKKLQNTIRALHSLGRAYIVRQHVNRMLQAVSMLQQCAREFLKRNKIHYTKVRVANRIQGWVRGYKAREYMKEAVDYLASKRKERFRARAVKKAQNRWKGLMIRRRFKQLKQAACTLQQYARANARRKMFLSIKRAAIGLQSGVRGMKARDTVRTVRNEKMVAEEQLRIKESNQREAKLLCNLNASRATATSNAKSRNFRYDLMDVDILVDNGDVYEGGWSKNAVELDNELAKRGRRISNVLVGSAHTLALTDTGELWTWGWSDAGQLGHGSHSHEKQPRPLENLMFQSQTSDVVVIERAMSGRLSIKQVAVGEDHTLALGDTGKVFSWGNSKKGQLGHGEFKSIAFPRCIQALKWATTSIACGSHHSIAIGHGGALYEWGSSVAMGGVQLTNSQTKYVNDKGDVSFPANMKDLIKEKIRSIQCGSKFSLALTYDGDVYSWGSNDFNELGRPRGEGAGVLDIDATPQEREEWESEKAVISRPQIIKELKLKRKHHAGVVHMSAGARHSVVCNSTGQVMCWGWNEFGNLGNGDTYNYEGIHQVLGDLTGKQALHVAAGWRNSAALTADGDVFVWGLTSLSARDSDRPMPQLPGKKAEIVNLGPMQSVSVAPKKIYRAGQSLTTAIEVHSSWSRNISTLSVTVRSRHTELPLTSSGLIDWRTYLLKKVNTLIAMQGKPEADHNLTDETREFVVKSIGGVGAGLGGSLGAGRMSPVASSGSLTGKGGGISPSKTMGGGVSPTKIGGYFIVLSERDLRNMNGNDLRTFARQLKNGEIKVQPRHDIEKRGGMKSPTRGSGQTFGEQNTDFFRTNIRGGDAADEDIVNREKGWNNHHNSKRDKNWGGGTKGMEGVVSINRELKKREIEQKEVLEAMAKKGVDGIRIEEEEKRQREKALKAALGGKKKEMEVKRLRMAREGKKKVVDEDILDFFKVEHLVAASNDNYTSAQVKEIYQRAGREHKAYSSGGDAREVLGAAGKVGGGKQKEGDSSLAAITRRLSMGFRGGS